MIGKTVGQYKITEKLGAGGMGEVFLADDSKLHRKVALKFLPEKFSADPEFKSRFEHEARAAAALNHPNIITVYDLGEYEGRLFIAMEHVAGQTLGDMIDSDSISLRKALDLASQITEGLDAAHKTGIVHRDIKPANILVDESGRARILDFGLAKSRKATTETKLGSTLGTIQYESPEQSRGEVVDNRSDLFSLGVVFYEMITGKLPFAGEYDEAIRYAISHEAAEPLARYKSDVPAEMEQVVSKLLEKEPEMRYQTASGVIPDLKRILRNLTQTTPALSRITPPPSDSVQAPVSEAPAPQKKRNRLLIPGSIVFALILTALIFKPWKIEVSGSNEAQASADRVAVMYFDNLFDPDDQTRMGEIVTDLLITNLSQTTSIQVVSSQRLYDILKMIGKEGVKSVDRQIASRVAEKAQAKWMLTGKILQMEPEYVLSAQLVEVATGNILASERINGVSGEKIFSVVDKLTAGISHNLARPKITEPQQKLQIAKVSTNSLEAYRYYMEGKEFGVKQMRDKAANSFRKAIEEDSTFAMAWYELLEYVNDTKRRTTVLRSADLVDYASDFEQRLILARKERIVGDLQEAIRQYEEIIRLYPNDLTAYKKLSNLYGNETEVYSVDKGIELLLEIIALDPLDRDAYNFLAYAYSKAGNYERSIWAINKYIEIAPDEPNPYDTRGELFADNGKLEQAIASYSQALELDPTFVASLQGLARMYVFTGAYDSAEAYCRKMYSDSDPEVREDGRRYLADLSVYLGKYRDALRLYDDLIDYYRLEMNNDYRILRILSVRASLFMQLGDTTASENEVQRALAFHKEHAGEDQAEDRDLILAKHYARIGDLRSQEYFDKYAEAKLKENDLLSFRFRLEKGALAFIRNEAPTVIPDYEEIEVVSPWFWIQAGLGQAYLETGRVGDAVQKLEQALGHYDRYRWPQPFAASTIHYLLGQAYQASGWNDKAVEQYEEFLTIWKDADHEIEELQDAKKRLAELRS